MTRKVAVQGLDEILTRVASPVNQNLPPEISPVKGRRFKSRFFFVVPEEELQALRAANAPKAEAPENAELVALAESMGTSLPIEIRANAERVRKFFLEELAPLTLAISVGETQVRDILKQATNGGQVDTSTFAKFDKMAREAVSLRMAVFLESYLGLEKGEALKLLPAATPQVPAPVPPATPKEEEAPSGFRRLEKTLRRLAETQERGGRNGPISG